MMISSENAGKVTEEGNFPCAVCRKVVGNTYIVCQFCRCLLHEGYSGVRGKLKGITSLIVRHLKMIK